MEENSLFEETLTNVDNTQSMVSSQNPMGLTEAELNTFSSWVTGTEDRMPQQVSNLMHNLNKKLAAGIGISVSSSIPRQARVSRYLDALSADLFNPEMLPNLSLEDKIKLMDMASKQSLALLKAQAEFIKISREISMDSREDAIANKIRALTPSQLDSLSKWLEDGCPTTVESVAETNSEVSVEDML